MATAPVGGVLGVVGSPVGHSLSPRLHQAALQALGLDWASVRFEVGRGGGAQVVEAVRALGIRGLSVTMPLKEEVAAAVDRLDPTAARLGSVNCLSLEDGEVVGLSTDGAGLLASLAHAAGFDAASKRVALIGAGGAARSIAAALAEVGVLEVAVIARDATKAAKTAALAGAAGRVGEPTDIALCDLVIETTPVGMAGTEHAEASSLADPDLLSEGQVAVDLVYSPRRTAWLEAAGSSGATAIGGLGMLVHQAALQIERWTGRDAPVAAMWAAVSEEAS
jgi:shikimate dehydrogenase